MAIAVEWVVPPLDDAQLASLHAVYQANAEIKAFLPTFAPMQAFVFQGMNPFGVAGPDGSRQLDPKNLPPPQFIARNGGFDLQRFDIKGNLAWVASIRPEFVSVNCTAYDRWKNVKPQVLAILRPFVDAAMAKGAKINAIGLQYQDAFRLLDGASPAVTRELFRKDGKYLPTHLFDQPSFWHCHQGWFSKGPDERRILNNIATEVAEVNGMHFARIGGQHRMFATSANGPTPMPINAEGIDEVLQCLHDENIDLINGVLSDGALKAIGCTVGGT
ncbi:TIGR04255 family protein [Variovorax paradoxus]|jgi:uncharacterized protein (TIGR04255 family)|uniref:TIGR04255 family protein n=1 Tax=Variovorax paradoxus TaxID=34073 RepID=UPI0004883F5B